jgi:hypothetical protein
MPAVADIGTGVCPDAAALNHAAMKSAIPKKERVVLMCGSPLKEVNGDRLYVLRYTF